MKSPGKDLFPSACLACQQYGDRTRRKLADCLQNIYRRFGREYRAIIGGELVSGPESASFIDVASKRFEIPDGLNRFTDRRAIELCREIVLGNNHNVEFFSLHRAKE